MYLAGHRGLDSRAGHACESAHVSAPRLCLGLPVSLHPARALQLLLRGVWSPCRFPAGSPASLPPSLALGCLVQFPSFPSVSGRDAQQPRPNPATEIYYPVTRN